MTNQRKAKIFLAEERGLHQADGFRSESTFRHENEHKHRFGNIYLLNDDMLASGRRMNLSVGERSHAIILPLAGAVKVRKSAVNENLVVAGQALIYSIWPGETIEIINPFAEEFINYLKILTRPGDYEGKLDTGALTFNDVNTQINKLTNIFTPGTMQRHPSFSISIGKFSGRGEAVYSLTRENAGCFLFVIAGAFEVNGCLLHARDGLGLWNAGQIEMEALSNDAIILLIETSK